MNDETSLMPAGRGELATAAGAVNSLVARGLGELIPKLSLAASALKDYDAKFYYNRGQRWLEKQHYDEAIADFTEAIRLDPSDRNHFFARANAWSWKVNHDNAIKDFDEVIRLDPNYCEAYAARARAWFRKRDYDKAISDFGEALRLSPTTVNYLIDRGFTWAMRKEYDKANMDYTAAVSRSPRWASRRIAWVLATCPHEQVRDGILALQLARMACDLTDWKAGQELDTLAAAFAEAGQFDEAVRYQTNALEDPICRGPAGDAFRRRLELYKQRKAFRECT